MPITPAEIAREAAACATAGASVLHLHVRDGEGQHSLDAGRYRDAIAAIRAVTGDDLIVQITTEAVGRYTRHEQMALVRELRPQAVSLAVRELVPDDAAESEALDFVCWAEDAGIGLQFIVYDAEDARRFVDFRLKAEATDTLRLKAEATDTFRLKAEATDTFRLKAEATDNFRLKAEATDTFRLKAEATDTFRLKAEATDNFRLKAEATKRDVASGFSRKTPHALFVLGRYSTGQRALPRDLLPFLEQWPSAWPWTVCAFGPHEAACLADALALGGHVRVGFENNLLRPDGTSSSGNAEQVAHVRGLALRARRRLATVAEARAIYGLTP